MDTNKLRWLARIIVVVWAGFWTFFAVASAMGPQGVSRSGTLWPVATALLIFVGTAVLAWRWETPAAILLLVEGLFVCSAYATGYYHARYVSQAVFVLSTLALPPVVAALLLLVCGHGSVGHHAA